MPGTFGVVGAGRGLWLWTAPPGRAATAPHCAGSACGTGVMARTMSVMALTAWQVCRDP